MQVEEPPAPNHPTDPKTGSREEGATSKGSDLEEPLELGPEMVSFLRGSLETSGDESNVMPPEPAVLEFSQWVPWKVEKCETPRLVVQVVSSTRNGRLQKACQGGVGLHPASTADARIGNEGGQPPGSSHTHHASVDADLCHWPNLIYACRDIREIPQEKVVAYARALQHWLEEINLPARGGLHLLAE